MTTPLRVEAKQVWRVRRTGQLLAVVRVEGRVVTVAGVKASGGHVQVETIERGRFRQLCRFEAAPSPLPDLPAVASQQASEDTQPDSTRSGPALIQAPPLGNVAVNRSDIAGPLPVVVVRDPPARPPGELEPALELKPKA